MKSVCDSLIASDNIFMNTDTLPMTKVLKPSRRRAVDPKLLRALFTLTVTVNLPLFNDVLIDNEERISNAPKTLNNADNAKYFNP